MSFSISLAFARLKRHEADSGEDLSPWFDPDAAPEQQLALVKRIEGREILSLRVLCAAFGDSANANKMRTFPGRLADLARLAIGKDLVVEHSLDVRDVVGEIFLAREEEGELIIGQKITDFGEMLAFAQGRRKHFSILFGSDEWQCSSCGEVASIKKGGEASFSCGHSIECSELLATGDLFFGHNSVTATPAWSGTKILNPALLSAALSKFSSDSLSEHQEDGGSAMNEEEKKAYEDIKAALETALEALEEMTSSRDEAVEGMEGYEDEQLESEFDVALSRGAVVESERKTFAKLKAGMGFRFAVAQLASRKGSAIPSPVGFSAGEFTPADTGSKPDTFALARLSAGRRYSEESLKLVENKGSLVRNSFIRGLNKR